MERVNQPQRAYYVWNILVRVAQLKGQLITYGTIAREIGIDPRTVKYVLGLIQDHCLQNALPPLTILAVDRHGNLGSGFTAWDVDNASEGLRLVNEWNWLILDNPFNYAKNGLTNDDIIAKILSSPEGAEEVYHLVKGRGAIQSFFRIALLEAYDYRCAFCDFSYTFALEASHIQPWAASSKKQRLDITNGILLCPNHHKLFDCGFLGIDEQFLIMYCDLNMSKYGNYSHADIALTVKLHNFKMNLPEDIAHWPSQIFLKWHRDKIYGK